ncbi:uncharacterized protein CDV56_100197 [Aspergillus thermomutatus]|uniref:Uncharacterized protein n=1 Tax=Aspergillus thermomutatus TaxID=41047 RepID=A0A397FZ74_ASPTH|nr:uncharacterized protein CDV56_100197 [Aspergillus thermomutatus]RHZ43109.1 hypothetical protein CDV56_100197 [Aspergillus thermomutatus]
MQHRHNHILTLICRGMDRVLDRARATLERTQTSIREIFGCRMPGQRTRKRPLGRLQPETERRYVRYWKQFLCFLIRAICLSREDRKRLLGVHLDKEQERTLEILWGTLNRYLECPDLDVWTDDDNPFQAQLQLPGRRRRLADRLNTGSEQGQPPCESREATTTPQPEAHPPSLGSSRRYTKRPRSMQRHRSCSHESDNSLSLHSSRPARQQRNCKQPRLDCPLRAEPPVLQRAVAVCIPIYSSIQSPAPDSTWTSSVPKSDSDPVVLHSSPGINSDNSSTEVAEATTDETGSVYSDSHGSDTEDDEQEAAEELEDNMVDDEEEDEDEDEDEDGSSLDPDEPLRGSEELDSRSDPCWGEAAPEHPLPGQFPALPAAAEEWISEVLVSLCISCLTTDAIYRCGDKFYSSLVAFAAVLGIRPQNCSFYEPYYYTTKLAGIAWVARLLLLEYALPIRRYRFISDVPSRDSYRFHVRRAQEIQGIYGAWDTFFPLNDILAMLVTVYHHQLPDSGLPLARLRQWVQQVIESATTLLEHNLLLGHRSPVDVRSLVDNPVECRSGFSFLDVPVNRLRATAAPILGLTENPPAGVAPLRRHGQWDPPSVRRYQQSVRMFLHQLMLAIQLSWGQPSRGSELMTVKWRKTAAAPRNLYIHEGEMVIITHDHEAWGRTARQHICARFLPPSVSRLVLLYLLHVRPFMATLVPWIAPTQLRKALSSCDLFTAPGFKSPSNARRGPYGRLLQQSSREFFGHFTLKALTYRHLLIAITKKHLKAKATVVDLRSAAENLDSIFAAQAGHSGSVNRHIYGVEESQPLQPLQPLPEMLHLYQYASHQWHQFILAPVEDPRPAPVSGSPSMSSPGPEQPPMLPDHTPQQGVHRRQLLPWDFFRFYPRWHLLLCSRCHRAVTRTSAQDHLQAHCTLGITPAHEVMLLNTLDLHNLQDIHPVL